MDGIEPFTTVINARSPHRNVGNLCNSLDADPLKPSPVVRCIVHECAVPTNTIGPGIFERTTCVHRVNTTGGLAPANAPTQLGQEARVPYTAEYLFYREK